VLARARTQYDGRIDHVAGTHNAAQLAGLAGTHVIKRDDHHLLRTQQSREPDLASSISPSLCNNARWNRDVELLRASLVDEELDPLLISLERDQRPGIQC